MNKCTLSDVKFAVVGTIIGYFLVVMPILKFIDWIEKIKQEEKNPIVLPVVIYFKEIK